MTMRNPTHITVHCSATLNSPVVTMESIKRYHIDVNKWADIGYHFVIETGGELRAGRPLTMQGAHVAGHNANNIGICLVGGLDENLKPAFNYTPEQMASLSRLIGILVAEYNIPDTNIVGHRDWYGGPSQWKKVCPCFDVNPWWLGERAKQAALLQKEAELPPTNLTHFPLDAVVEGAFVRHIDWPEERYLMLFDSDDDVRCFGLYDRRTGKARIWYPDVHEMLENKWEIIEGVKE